MGPLHWMFHSFHNGNNGNLLEWTCTWKREQVNDYKIKTNVTLTKCRHTIKSNILLKHGFIFCIYLGSMVLHISNDNQLIKVVTMSKCLLKCNVFVWMLMLPNIMLE
jgi:hypothetical protein